MCFILRYCAIVAAETRTFRDLRSGGPISKHGGSIKMRPGGRMGSLGQTPTASFSRDNANLL